MIIKKANIRNFGKLSDERIDFLDGINIVYGQNESGKTTLHSFLLNALFGISRNRGKASKTDDYVKYEPLNQQGNYSGSINIVSKGKEYIINRDFSAGKRKDSIIEADSNTVLNNDSDTPDKILGNISRRLYTNTQSCAQGEETDVSFVYDLLKDKYAQITASGEDRSISSKIIRELSTRKKKAEAQCKAVQAEYDEKLKKTLSLIEYEKEETEKKEHRLAQIRRNVSETLGEHEKEIKSSSGNKNGKIPIVMLILAVLSLAISVLLKGNIAAIACTAAFAFAFVLSLLVKNIGKAETETSKTKAEAAAKEAQWEKKYLEEQICVSDKKIKAFKAEYERQAALRSEADGNAKKINALELALSLLRKIAADEHHGTGKKFRTDAERIFLYLTGSTDTRLVFDENDEISILRDGTLTGFWQCSKSTKELIVLSVRLAAAGILIKGETMPVLLDDAFVNFDDDRLKRTLVYLYNIKRQVIIFTCQKREKNILDELSIKYSEVRWSGNC